MSDGQGPRRQRGVRLTDLDRDRLYVIGHNGRRWETLGTLGDPDAVAPLPARAPGASAEGASTGARPGRHAAPDPWAPDGTPAGP